MILKVRYDGLGNILAAGIPSEIPTEVGYNYIEVDTIIDMAVLVTASYAIVSGSIASV